MKNIPCAMKRLFTFVLTAILALGILSPMASAAPVGTTPANPVQVAMEETYSWSWTKNTDHLYCYNRFTVDEVGFIHFRVDKLYDTEGEMGKYNIDLYDEDGTIVSAFRCTYSRDLPKQYYDFYVGLKPGTYFLNLKPGFIVRSGVFTASYSFSFEPTSCEQEPNESKAAANLLTANQWTDAYFGNDGAAYDAEEADWFKYNMVKGNKYRIYFRNFAKIESTTAIYEVYSPSNNDLYKLSLDNYSSTDSDGNTYWDYVAEETGTYFFRVYNYLKEQFKYGIMVYDPNHVHSWQESGSIAPTCTEPGEKTYICTICHATKTESIAALGHKFESGVCTVCGAPVQFTDVNDSNWFAGAVKYAVTNNLFNGTGDGTTFSPNMAMSRAMLVTVLHRQAGTPASSGENVFSDVPNTSWYTKAVLWASENGIVTGSNGKFMPNDAVTREQISVILFRYTQKQGKDTSNRADLAAFPDGDLVSGWAKDAMQWAVAEKLISGNTKGELMPKGEASRAQVATILMRYIENILQ